MRKIILLLIIAFTVSTESEAQRFPIPVLSGDTVRLITSRGYRTIPVKNDTLWIFNGSQFKSALAKAKKLEYAEEQIVNYNMQLEVYRERGQEKDSLIKLLEKDRDYYKNNWTVCTEDLEKQVKRCKRKSIFNKLAIAGIPVAFVVGLLLAK